VRFLRVLDCFKIMGPCACVEEGRPDCLSCEYFRRWGDGVERAGSEPAEEVRE
jgi:hypothetical protein